MDIPKQPAQSVLTSSVSMSSAALKEHLLSDINALNLQAGKQYPASVVMTPQMQTSLPPSGSTSTVISTEENTLDNPADTKGAATTRSPASAAETKPDAVKLLQNEYLLRINAKTILINSEKPLSIGDKLFISLDPGLSSGKPSLIARTPEQQSILTQAQTTSAVNQSTPVQQNSAQLNTSLLNAQQITQLLQALNLSMDKQLPLQESLSRISSLLAEPASPDNNSSHLVDGKQATRSTNLMAGHANLEPLLRQHLQQQLMSLVTRSTDILNTQISEALSKPDPNLQMKPGAENQALSQGSLSSGSAMGVVKSALMNSGLFLENRLLSQPEMLQTFKAQLDSLQSNLLQIDSQMSNSNPGNAATLQRIGHSLNKIQQTIELLIENTSKTMTGYPTGQARFSPTDPNLVLPDLKASLVSLAAQLSRQLAKEAPAEALKNMFLLPVENDYALSPFAFPMLSAHKSSATRNLFENQEFTTGQLLKLLAGMIHRLQFNQLHSLLQSNSNTDGASAQQSWFFELPVMNPQQQVHTFNFRIDKEPQSEHRQTSEKDKSVQWKLLLSFDLEALGPVYVQVKFLEHVSSAAPSISSVLWADKTETLNLLRSEAPLFQKSLENLGLKVTELRCEQGQPTQTKTRLDRHLVDTRA